ncbi:MAG: hypothetical protein ACRDIU_03830 [Actinomycetota bacterium]
METLSFLIVVAVMVGIPIYLIYAWFRAAKEAEKPTPLEEISQ